MTTSTKTVEIKVERTIPAPPSEVFDAWLDPKIPGTPWHEESTVTVTFQKKGEGTLMTLLHSGLPNDDIAKAHENGWNSISDKFSNIFVSGSHRRK